MAKPTRATPTPRSSDKPPQAYSEFIEIGRAHV